MPLDQKIIYLTFDDGPTPEITNWVLNLLKSYQAKATFFCIGNNIEKHPDIFQAILNDGHAIGNHSFDHPKGWKTKSEIYVNQVLKTQEIINQQSLNSKFEIPNSKFRIPKADNNPQFTINNPHSSIPKLFRPPYGQITTKQGKRLLNLGYTIIMWDVLAFDWKDSLTPEKCAKNVISKAGNGSIIVFHDSVKASERMKFALTKTLEHFSKEGFVFKSIQ